MRIFIENEANSNKKNLFNEKTLEFIKTIEVARAYPYPYGFILGTTAEDEDNIDAFVITDRKLKKGQIVDCEPIGLMEQFEKSWDKSKSNIEEIDHNVLVVLKEEKDKKLNKEIKNRLTEFVTCIFDNIQKNKTRVGQFLSKEDAIRYVEEYRD